MSVSNGSSPGSRLRVDRRPPTFPPLAAGSPRSPRSHHQRAACPSRRTTRRWWRGRRPAAAAAACRSARAPGTATPTRVRSGLAGHAATLWPALAGLAVRLAHVTPVPSYPSARQQQPATAPCFHAHIASHQLSLLPSQPAPACPAAEIPPEKEAIVFEEIATMDFPFEGIPTVPPRKDMDHMAFFCGGCRSAVV